MVGKVSRVVGTCCMTRPWWSPPVHAVQKITLVFVVCGQDKRVVQVFVELW